MRRFFALVFLLLIIACIFATLIAAICKAPVSVLFFLFFLDFAIPVSIYAYFLISRQLAKAKEEKEQAAE